MNKNDGYRLLQNVPNNRFGALGEPLSKMIGGNLLWLSTTE